MRPMTNTVIRGRWHLAGLALLAIVVAAGRAAAADGDYVWQGTADASWNNAANWDEGGVPTSFDNVFLPTPSAAISTIVMSTGGAAADLFVQGQHRITAGTLSFGNLLVGSDTTARLIVSNGGSLSGATGSIGYDPAPGPSTVIVTGLSGGSLTTTNTLNVGYRGAGHVLSVVDSGSATLGNLWIGGLADSGSNSVVVLGTGSRLTASSLVVGSAGVENTMFVQDGATLTTTTEAYLGYESTSPGNVLRITGTGAQWLHTGPLQIGVAGAGNAIDVSFGAAVSITGSDDVVLGVAATSESNGLYVNAGTFSAPAAIVVGNASSSNLLNISAGATVTSALGRLGVEAGADGNLAIVSGTGSSWTVNGTVRVGGLGDANRLVIADGGLVTVTGGKNFWIGPGAGSDDNVVTVSGSGSTLRLTGLGGEVVVSGSGGTSNRLVIADSGTVATASVKLGPGRTRSP